jgi:23S rRNA (cytosine1962-C5)-methyltransferase
MHAVFLKPKKEESVRRFHPWVFSGAIQKIDGQPSEGELVKVLDSQGNFLGIGHFQQGSIMVRLLSFQEEPIDENFWKNRITESYRMRKALGLIIENRNNCYRLVHGEGDGLPGLIVDVYGNTAVMQAHSAGMHKIRNILAKCVVESVPEIHHLYYKSEATLPFRNENAPADGYLVGGFSEQFVALENGLKFYIDWQHGQKTGFFLDQRENRVLLERYASGRTVLNMFCYTGGFSVYALRGNAKLVHSVDSSAKAIELTDKNVALNFSDQRHQSFAEDAFKYLQRYEKREPFYDLIVLDPPAFAKHRDAVSNALKGYRRLNRKAFEMIRPGGIIFTFSCSQAITREQFRQAVFSAAAESKRNVRILHQLSQGIDHPINIYHPEGEYLKGLVLWVE